MKLNYICIYHYAYMLYCYGKIVFIILLNKRKKSNM